MKHPADRREFLAKGAATAGAFIAGAAVGHAQEKHAEHQADGKMKMKMPPTGEHQGHMQHEMGKDMGDYPRTQPGIGGPVGSPTDRGKLVPGYRDATLPPVPIHAPDVKSLPWEEVNGAKEFHLIAEPVRREVLPGVWMDTLWLQRRHARTDH